jgi:hypothetical protein
VRIWIVLVGGVSEFWWFWELGLGTLAIDYVQEQLKKRGADV